MELFEELSDWLEFDYQMMEVDFETNSEGEKNLGYNYFSYIVLTLLKMCIINFILATNVEVWALPLPLL